MFSLKNNIQIDRQSTRPVYLQICDHIVRMIKMGNLTPNTKLPGSRKLAEELSIHRKTAIMAYEELFVQGWIESFPAKGTFVCKNLPVVTPIPLESKPNQKVNNECNFEFKTYPILKRRKALSKFQHTQTIDDGVPDHRLAPIDEISKLYKSVMKTSFHIDLLAYGDVLGNIELRKQLVTYLSNTRGLHITEDQILITRGTQMGIYLASQLLVSKHANIITGNTNYKTADDTFVNSGANILRVPVDAFGIDTNAIQNICEHEKVNAVYVTSHHHHPTTVTLSAERRMHLLKLAKKYNFAIVEDDYDFHYDNAPILPLASNDPHQQVIYIGSFTKLIAPALRIGYFIASKEVIEEASAYRRIIDRQGDPLLEQVLSRMLKDGSVQRHSNKLRKLYKIRRDFFCKLFYNELSEYFDFEIPKGGMAVWIILKKPWGWETISTEAQKHQLQFATHWSRYDNDGSGHQGIRMGFASHTKDEIQKIVDKLILIFKALKQQS